jgi:mannose-6-phosphate isomerase-like protein (cupin superfamily)
VSIARGQGRVTIEGVEATVKQHDHFAIPSGMAATLAQEGNEPLVALEAVIRR